MRPPAATDVRILGRIRKSERAEIRVLRQVFKGRDVVDVRVWYIPDGAGDFIATRRGLQFDVSKVGELIAALEKA